MELLPEVYFKPLYFGDDPDNDPDSGPGSLSRSLGEGLHFWSVLPDLQ